MKKWEYKVLKVEKIGEINAFGDWVKGTIHFRFKDLGEDHTYEVGTGSLQILNELGAQGWELVDTTEYARDGETIAVNFNFKREIE